VDKAILVCNARKSTF